MKRTIAILALCIGMILPTTAAVGRNGRAEYEEQTRLFWIAWEDDGYHHWAAQKGRCF